MDPYVQTGLVKTGEFLGPRLAEYLAEQYGPAILEALGYGATAAATTAAAETGAATAGSMAPTYSGPWAVLAPLIGTWMAYSKGSGRNDPMIKRYRTLGAGKMMADLMDQQKNPSGNPDDIDSLKGVYGKYFLPVKYKQGYNPATGWDTGQPLQGIDEGYDKGYSMQELYHMMHSMGRGGQGMGYGDYNANSGLTDEEIDNMFYKSGLSQSDLAKALGLQSMPDYSGGKTYSQNWADLNKNNPDYYAKAVQNFSPVPQRVYDSLTDTYTNQLPQDNADLFGQMGGQYQNQGDLLGQIGMGGQYQSGGNTGNINPSQNTPMIPQSPGGNDISQEEQDRRDWVRMIGMAY